MSAKVPPAGERAVSSELSRELSLFQITMMGLGMMIGAGVFVGIGNSVAVAGPGGMLLTFGLNGLIAVLTAMSYAELSSAIPRAGGAYNFARVGFGRGTSFLAGWMEWFASSVAGSLYAVTFGLYVGRYLKALGLLGWVWSLLPAAAAELVTTKVIALLVAAFFLYINYRGASETGRIGAFFTLGQTLFLIVIGLVGLVVVVRDPARLANFKPFMPAGWSRLLVTMGLTYVAFEGYEVIAQAGDEAIEPRRNLPKAMIYSVFVVTLTYVATAFAAVVAVKPGADGLVEGKVPWEWIGQFRDTGFGEAVSRLMPAGNFLLTLAVIFASTSALNATIYSATRASFALGRDRMLPAFFAKIHPLRRTPWAALLASGGIVIVVATCLPTRDVASSASIMFLFLFFLVNLCVIKIRRNMGDELTYGFVMPLFPVLPLAAIVCQVALVAFMHEMSLTACIVAPLWVGAGVVVYHFYSKSHALATADEILVFEEERAPEAEKAGYRVMVAVANPKSAVEMVRNTYKLCRAKGASVELLHMVPVPEQVPLSDAEKYMLEGKEGIVEAMLYLAPQFPLSTTLRYCRNAARGIVSAVRQKRTDMLILGWHGRYRRYAFRLGSTVDPVVERVPCDVVIMKDCSYQEYHKVLVPVAGGPNGALALEVASILAEKEDGRLTAFTVEAGRRPAFELGGFVEQNSGRLALPRQRLETKTVGARDPAAAILKEAEEGGYDLVVMGTTRQPLLRQMTLEPLPETVAQRLRKPVVMVKASSGIRSWVKRWI